jgi:flavin reductase (DIM6/NTAB) family NADH-FMN oxidoreductase RutF
VPRPIAWVSTVDGADRPNLAPFSFFNVAGVNPPVLCFSPLLDRAKDEKHTLANIREVGEFVVNIVNVDLVEHMNLTGAPYPAGVSEFAKAGLTPQPSKTIRPPSVGEALVSYECRLLQIIDLGATPLAGNLVLGLVCRIRVADDLFLDDKIDDRRLDAVARLAGCRYATMRDTFELPRATIEEE